MTEPREPVDGPTGLPDLETGCGEPAWLRALQFHGEALADAVGGAPITIEVKIDGSRPCRVGIHPDGFVQWPMGEAGAYDVRLEGSRDGVLRFLQGEGDILSARLDGLLHVAEEEVGPLKRLRRAAAEAFRAFGVGSIAAVVAVRRRLALDRLWMPPPAMAEAVATAAAACAVLVGGTSGALAAPSPPIPRVAASSPAKSAAHDKTRMMHLSIPTPAAAQAGRRAVVPTPTHREAAGRIDETGVVVKQSAPGSREKESWVDVDCRHPVGEVVCNVEAVIPAKARGTGPQR